MGAIFFEDFLARVQVWHDICTYTCKNIINKKK